MVMRQNQFQSREHFENHMAWAVKARKRFLGKLEEELTSDHREQLQLAVILTSKKATIIDYTIGDDIEHIKELALQLIDDLISSFESPGSDLTETNDLEFYIDCLWYLSFCYFFDVPKEKVQLIADHISLTGKDMLIDRLIAASIPGNPIAVGQLAFPEVYKPLSEALSFNQTTEKRTEKIQLFLQNYYPMLKKYNVTWHESHKELNLDYCKHFGYWIFELGALAADIGWDDTAYRDHEMYPKDLVDWKFAQRPDYRKSKI